MAASFNRGLVLQYVMRHAYDRRYRGKGWLWAWTDPEDLREVLKNKEHIPVLKSKMFNDCVWTIKVVAGPVLSPTRIPGDYEEEMARHCREVQEKVDPLLYMIKNLGL